MDTFHTDFCVWCGTAATQRGFCRVCAVTTVVQDKTVFPVQPLVDSRSADDAHVVAHGERVVHQRRHDDVVCQMKLARFRPN